MKQFFMEHWELVTSFITLLFLIIGVLMKQKFSSASKQEDNMDDKVGKIEEEIKEIKDNYLDKFAEVMVALGEIKVSVATIETAVKAQEKFCKYVQNQKIKNI